MSIELKVKKKARSNPPHSLDSPRRARPYHFVFSWWKHKNIERAFCIFKTQPPGQVYVLINSSAPIRLQRVEGGDAISPRTKFLTQASGRHATPSSREPSPPPFCRIFVKIYCPQSVLPPPPPLVRVASLRPSRHDRRRRNHSMTSLPSKLSCLCLHTASLRNPRFVSSHQTTADKLASVFPIHRGGGGKKKKRVCPLASPSQSVGDIQHPFLLPPAIKLTRHILDWGSTAYSGPSETGDYASVLRVVIWNLGSLKITYGYRDCIASFIEVIGRG